MAGRGGPTAAALAALAGLMASCSSAPAAPAGPLASEASVRHVADDFYACSLTSLTPAADADCFAQAVQHVTALHVPQSLLRLADTTRAAARQTQGCFSAATAQTLDGCAATEAAFFRSLTSLEYSLAQKPGTIPRTAPVYWSLQTSAALRPEMGEEVFQDSLAPPDDGWPRQGSWSFGDEALYSGTARAGRLTIAHAPMAGLASFEMTVTAQLTSTSGAVGISCSQGTRRYYLLVSDRGIGVVLRAENSTAVPVQVVDDRRDDRPIPPGPRRITAVCMTLSVSGGTAVNRLLLFAGSELRIDTVDTWKGQTGTTWNGALVVDGFGQDATATFSDVVVRDFTNAT